MAVQRGCGRHLPAGHSVNEIIGYDRSDVHVPAGGVDEVIPADVGAIAVPHDGDDFQVGPGDFDSGGHRQCASMDRVDDVGFAIKYGLPRAADSPDHDDPAGIQLKMRKGPQEGIEDHSIATSGTPASRKHPPFEIAIHFLGWSQAKSLSISAKIRLGEIRLKLTCWRG